MRRSSFITWDQLKVGVLILVALLILGIAIVKLGQVGNLFGKRYRLVAFNSNASGLKLGGPVTVAGQLSGSIKDIQFLPPDVDTTKNLKLVVEVSREVTEQVRRDSRGGSGLRECWATRCSISLGNAGQSGLHEGAPMASIRRPISRPSCSRRSGRSVRWSGSRTLEEGDRQRHRARERSPAGHEPVAVRSAQWHPRCHELAHGAARKSTRHIGRLLNDPALYYSLNRTIASADTIIRQISTSNGTVGKLLRDDTLYVHLVNVVTKADSLVSGMSNGNGTMHKLFTDQQLYDELVKTVTELNKVLVDVRRDPDAIRQECQRYFRKR